MVELASSPVGTQRAWTVSEIEALPDPPPCEIIEGVLYVAAMPFSPHPDIVSNLLALFDSWVRPRRLGKVYAPQTGLYYNEKNYLDPDLVFLLPSQRVRRGQRVTQATLAVEVLSPSNDRAPREDRESLFQKIGVPELWYVDYDSRSLEVRRLGEDGFSTVAVFKDEDVVSSLLFHGLEFPLSVVWEDVEE